MCLFPITIKNPRFGKPILSGERVGFNDDRTHIQVPCGKCLDCLSARKNQWAVRMVMEQRYTPGMNYFVTLTYNDEFLPMKYVSVNGRTEHRAVLQYSDVQKFLKRLRTRIGSFRYFVVGEYGPNTNRPHYHIIFFGIQHGKEEFKRALRQSWSKRTTFDKERKRWNFTPFGYITCSRCNGARVQYIAKYCNSSALKRWWYSESENRQYRSRSGSSRRPGIGFGFTQDEQVKDWLISNETDRITVQGYTYSIGRYYADKIFTPHQKEAISRHKRIYMEEKQRDYEAIYGEYDLEQIDKGDLPYWHQQYDARLERARKRFQDKTKRVL